MCLRLSTVSIKVLRYILSFSLVVISGKNFAGAESNMSIYFQSSLISEYTWGPSKLLLTISSTC